MSTYNSSRESKLSGCSVNNYRTSYFISASVSSLKPLSTVPLTALPKLRCICWSAGQSKRSRIPNNNWSRNEGVRGYSPLQNDPVVASYRSGNGRFEGMALIHLTGLEMNIDFVESEAIEAIHISQSNLLKRSRVSIAMPCSSAAVG